MMPAENSRWRKRANKDGDFIGDLTDNMEFERVGPGDEAIVRAKIVLQPLGSKKKNEHEVTSPFLARVAKDLLPPVAGPSGEKDKDREKRLQVRAELSGTLESPSIKVRSNLDDAIAARLRGLVGEELAKAEAKARAAVDKLVDEQVRSLSGKVDALQANALQKLPVEKEQLDGVQKQLEAQLKRLAGSATGGISLPKL